LKNIILFSKRKEKTKI